MKNFMYACVAIAALSFAVHVWVQPAAAQAPGNPVVGTFGSAQAVVTANGDVYELNSQFVGAWHRDENIFTGPGPVNVQPQTLGQVKARYR